MQETWSHMLLSYGKSTGNEEEETSQRRVGCKQGYVDQDQTKEEKLKEKKNCKLQLPTTLLFLEIFLVNFFLCFWNFIFLFSPFFFWCTYFNFFFAIVIPPILRNSCILCRIMDLLHFNASLSLLCSVYIYAN